MYNRTVQFISSSGARWPWIRQTPSSLGVWDGTHFIIDKSIDKIADWLVVFDGLPNDQLITSVPLSRRIFITGEPESFYQYQRKFLAQFGCILTSQRGIIHPNIIYTQTGINWFAGVLYDLESNSNALKAVLNYDDFEKQNPIKSKTCSIICSNKAVTKGHRARLSFVQELKNALGDQLDIFGRGFREIADKDEALADYRYHIAIENSSHLDYWTEKIADPYLRGCFPIYYGCKNIGSYFPVDSYRIIDINKPDLAIQSIKHILDSNIDTQFSTALVDAKNLVLKKFNIFEIISFHIKQFENKNKFTKVCEASEILLSDAVIKNNLFRRKLKRYLKNIF